MSESEDSGPGRREVAYRLFAAEFDDADLSYSESDEERAPNYVVTPTGARVNRLFVVGVLTEAESVSEDVLRARVVDPTGAFVLYAGQYQPDERAFLERADPPTFVAVTGKARTFQPDDADAVYTSVRPESVNEIDAETRDRWTLQAAEQTVERVRLAGAALRQDRRGDALEALLRANGVDEGLAQGLPIALDHYGTTGRYLEGLYETALDAARLVAGDVDEVPSFDLAPSAAGEGDLARLDLPALDAEPVVEPEPEPEHDATVEAESGGGAAPEAAADTEPETAADSESEPEPATAADSEPEPEPEPEPSAEAEPAADTAAGDSEPDVAAAASDAASAPEHSAADADAGTGTADPAEDEVGDFEPDAEFDLDDDEREEIEAEYGTEFQSGTEVEEPGAADIDTPDPEAGEVGAEPETDAEPEPDLESEPEAEPETEAEAETAAEPADAGTEAEAESAGETAPDSAAEVEFEGDLEDLVVAVMEDLDEGSGVDRAAVVETAMERAGAEEDDVEAAIQDALMDGRCYEPDDTTLQPI